MWVYLTCISRGMEFASTDCFVHATAFSMFSRLKEFTGKHLFKQQGSRATVRLVFLV